MLFVRMDNTRTDIAGIVLAGGRSSRMGTNKALLDYQGMPLVEHMIRLLNQSGIPDVHVSGNVSGQRCIPDQVEYAGPAAAIRNVFEYLKGSSYKGILFVPVDMPLLTPKTLKILIENKAGGYFKSWPLPVFLPIGNVYKESTSVKEMLGNVPSIGIPENMEHCFINTNTPEDWSKVS